MKFLRTAFPATLIGSLALLGGCEKKPAMPAPPAGTTETEAAKTFQATASYLDSGGDFYLYLRTQQIMEKVPVEMDSWKEALLQLAGSETPMPREQIDKWYDVIKRKIMETGVTNLRAFGMSGIQLEPGLNRMKSVLYCGDVADRGLLWNLGGKTAPHPIAALDFLPATTAYAAFMDFDPQVLWNFVEKTMQEIPDKDVQNSATTLPAMAQMVIGMPPKDLFASLDSEVGVVITADETVKMNLPWEGGAITLPRATGALLLRVKDDKVYNLIVTKLEETVGHMMPVTKSEKDGVRLAVLKLPMDMGVPLSPTIARFGDYVAISSTEDLAMQLARKGPNPPPLMKDTPGFQRFAKLEKLEGNAFYYLSEAGSGMLRTVQLMSFDSGASPLPPALKPKIEQLYDLFTQKYAFSIGRIEKDGYVTTTYTPGGSKQIAAMVMLVPAALIGSLMVPAITEAKKTGEATRCLGELRQIEEAMKLFEADNNTAAGTTITPADLEPYISADTPLGKRLRAQPFVDSEGNAYPAFIAGSPPHVPAATAAGFATKTRSGYWGQYAPQD